MITSRYYKILGLHPNASEREVKQAYRTLVKRVHPDINPSIEAHNQFIKITEAYEIITGQRPTLNTRSRSSSQNVADLSNEKTAEQGQKEKYERYMKYKQRVEQIEYINQRRKYDPLRSGWRAKLFNSIVIISLVCFIILTVDYFMPAQVSKHRVEYIQARGYSDIYKSSEIRVHYDNGQSIDALGQNLFLLKVDDIFFIEKTKILNEKKSILIFYNDNYYVAENRNSVYAILPLAYIFLLIPLIAFFIRRDIWFFAYGFYPTIYGTSLFLCYFFLENSRILKMLQILQ